MKKEERKELEKEMSNINKSISEKQSEIINSPEYKKIQDSINELRKSMSGDSIKHNELRKEVYKKYGAFYSGYYSRVKLSEIKPSVKQGIKVGLGMTNVKSIKDDIVKIVKDMIAEDLKEPRIEELKQKKLEVEKRINRLVGDKSKLVADGTEALEKERDKVCEKLLNIKPVENKKLEKQKKEANEKVKNLPNYLPKIIKEVNKRLIVDSLK